MADLTHVHSYTPDERACPECGEHVYEIQVRPSAPFVTVTQWIFRSWTGPRRLDGEAFVGPVFILGGQELAR